MPSDILKLSILTHRVLGPPKRERERERERRGEGGTEERGRRERQDRERERAEERGTKGGEGSRELYLQTPDHPPQRIYFMLIILAIITTFLTTMS